MITREQLREIHGDRLPLHILEQDYIQCIFLKELYREVDSLVFKGGTFLKHALGLDRFSEDMDFTLFGDEGIKDSLKETSSELGSYGIDADIDRVNIDDLSLNARLRYRGPLYDGSERSIGKIDIEVSKRDDILIKPRWTRLFFEYPEMRVVNVLGLQKEELFAEKLRALSTRTKGRDLYDVWFLLKQGVTVNRDLFIKKMEVMDGPDYVSIDISEEEWEQDLKIVLVDPPEYEEVKEEVVDSLRKVGIEVR